MRPWRRPTTPEVDPVEREAIEALDRIHGDRDRDEDVLPVQRVDDVIWVAFNRAEILAMRKAIARGMDRRQSFHHRSDDPMPMPPLLSAPEQVDAVSGARRLSRASRPVQ